MAADDVGRIRWGPWTFEIDVDLWWTKVKGPVGYSTEIRLLRKYYGATTSEFGLRGYEQSAQAHRMRMARDELGAKILKYPIITTVPGTIY